jgi:hypothetical protein
VMCKRRRRLDDVSNASDLAHKRKKLGKQMGAYRYMHTGVGLQV